MSTRSELLTTVSDIIKDYREGEIDHSTPDHVDRWIRQFSESAQVPLLTELKHVLGQTYFAKRDVARCFDRQIRHEEIAGQNFCDFWKRANFLDIQANGESQSEILSFLEKVFPSNVVFLLRNAAAKTVLSSTLTTFCSAVAG